MTPIRRLVPLLALALLVAGCGRGEPPVEVAPAAGDPADAAPVADVLSVAVDGEPGAYVFHVEVASPDTGCEQYADWWEVLSASGSLISRRVLGHSHVDEQPFIRSGEPLDVDPNAMLWIRAHMNTGGYGGRVAHGSIAGGFAMMAMDAAFAAHVADEGPWPPECAY